MIAMDTRGHLESLPKSIHGREEKEKSRIWRRESRLSGCACKRNAKKEHPFWSGQQNYQKTQPLAHIGATRKRQKEDYGKRGNNKGCDAGTQPQLTLAGHQGDRFSSRMHRSEALSPSRPLFATREQFSGVRLLYLLLREV